MNVYVLLESQGSSSCCLRAEGQAAKPSGSLWITHIST